MLKGKTALITGATRGIGRQIALTLAKNGANIVFTGTKAGENAESVKCEIEKYGAECLFLICDVSDKDQVDSAVSKAIEKFGRIDILVNNAGITDDRLIMSMSEESFCRVIDVNLKGAYHTMHAVIRPMIKQKGGRIINISSVVGLMGNAGQANYAASKAGIVGLTKSAAKEYASRNITCNAIAPGFISTEMTDAMTDTAKQSALSGIPMGRTGSPEDVANAVLFLASDMAGYITGEVIKVDGGMYI